ncbi:pyridoxamine 5'-phosphate oxidase [Altererythrobacter litoralis]|uniref:Pyridoxine/pyridoxamine 5'-phosphate oxidase n=1 Tax=Altererythrobacter litoralis TaxID=3113904 RepID=A0ABU7GGV5_9SPHN|nr:pyridoxamine 5'-phosphate oxidase [Erythrobacteraceae bacterium 1XM1-14]
MPNPTPGQIARVAESEIPSGDPLALFAQWLAEAGESEPNDPNAMALATANSNGSPSVRMVLLKDHGPDGFTFYTNGDSRKGEEIRANMQAALLFHWKSLRRQIRIEGKVYEVEPELADAYFASRSRDSQLGALASDQSRPLASRGELLARVAKVAARHVVGSVLRPPHWTGFRLEPQRMEFWMDRPFRIHDRRQFDRTEDGWTNTLLYP